MLHLLQPAVKLWIPHEAQVAPEMEFTAHRPHGPSASHLTPSASSGH